MKIRGVDNWGSGAFGASRGSRTHNGIDICASPGDSVESLTYGKVTKLGWCYDWIKHPDRKRLRYVQVTLDGNEFRYFYLYPFLNVGDSVAPGDALGRSLDLQEFYPEITNHYHFEIIQPDGTFADPAGLIPEIALAVQRSKS